MGIPSYYKKLTSFISISSQHTDIKWLFFDFNCIIYQCIPSSSKPFEESELIASVILSTLRIIQSINPEGVYIAIDGVVPMAKMRQQRMRRFSSVIRSISLSTETFHWDKNAITPGTLFMQKLHAALEQMILDHPEYQWKFSSSNEPGEGEHKIMAEWRRGLYQGPIAIYGMDADLIVLCLLNQELFLSNSPVWLFREGEKGEEWFSIDELRKQLGLHRSMLLSYTFAMSILGNDFLPSSLSLKIRKEGHSELIQLLRRLFAQHSYLIDPQTLEISMEGLHSLFSFLSETEETRITQWIIGKQKEWYNRNNEEDWPLTQQEESCFMDQKTQELREDWKDKYLSYAGEPDEYLKGLQWIWSYYTGQEVCYNWYYPHCLPPLFSLLKTETQIQNTPILYRATDIKPVEQLVLVLPLESWSLIPSCPEKQFPYYAPQYFPKSFSFCSMGKRFRWECEPRIPIPNIHHLKLCVHSYAK
jgi:5'-3' exonuclease